MELSVTEATGISAAHDIHIADNGDMDQVSNILGRAFADDPILEWLCGQPQIYPEFFRAEVKALYKKYGLVYINRECTTFECAAVPANEITTFLLTCEVHQLWAEKTLDVYCTAIICGFRREIPLIYYFVHGG